MTETPDLPCPKCGSQRTEMVWCGAKASWLEIQRRDPAIHAQSPLAFGPMYRDHAGKERYCTGPTAEHFHRGCLRCDYRWITEDVVTG